MLTKSAELEMFIENGGFVLELQPEALNDKRLKFIEKSVYSLMVMADNRDRRIADRTIADLLDISESYIRTIKAKLRTLGYLVKEQTTIELVVDTLVPAKREGKNE